MSMLDTSDHNAKYESEDNDMPAYNQLEEYLTDLENKRNDLYEKHKRLLSDFQKSAIANLTNITESVQEQADNLSKTLSSHSSSDQENVSQLLRADEITRQIDLKIMKSGIASLEYDSNIIKFRTDKLLLDKEIYKKKRALNDKKIQFCNHKNQIQNAIIEINKNTVSLNESHSNFNYDKIKYTSIIKRILSEIHKLDIYLQNCEIRKQELINTIQSSQELYNQIQNLIYTQNENNKMKEELYIRNYSEDINKIRHKKEKITKELFEERNQITLSKQNEKLLKKKMKKIDKSLIEENNFEECLNSKLRKYDNAIEKSKQLVHNECELLYKDLENIRNQINHAKSENYSSYSQNNEDKISITNEDHLNDKIYSRVNDNDLQDIQQIYLVNQEKKRINRCNSKLITQYQKELSEINYETLLLKQKVLSAKKKIIESKIEFTELEQKAAALLRASVDKQRSILINQEQREILHDDYITDTMIAIQQARAKIIMNKANIDSTSTQNKFASNILKHVITCCSSKIDRDRYIFLPDNYVYLSQ